MKMKEKIKEMEAVELEDFDLIPEHVLVEDEVKRTLDRMRDRKQMDMFNDLTWNWSGLRQLTKHIMENYLAPVKTKNEFFLKLVKRVVKSDFTLNFMEDRNGRKAKFYSYKGDLFEQGECVLLTATVAEHRTSRYDNGKPLTYLNRVTIVKNMGSAKNESEEVLKNPGNFVDCGGTSITNELVRRGIKEKIKQRFGNK